MQSISEEDTLELCAMMLATETIQRNFTLELATTDNTSTYYIALHIINIIYF